MATKPTRQQERACVLVAEALLLIAEAARLDGGHSFGRAEITEIGRSTAKAVKAFDLDAIVSRSLELRGRALGLRSGTAELLTLVYDQVEPIIHLFMTDETFKESVAKAEEELGEV
jgi:hypothetical protein